MKFLTLLILCASLLMAGCGDERVGDDDSAADDDDSAADDDDSAADDDDTAGDDDSAAGGDVGSTSGSDDLGCVLDYNPVDVWSFELGASETITASVDTIAASTAFDPAILVLDGLDLSSEQLAVNNEFFDCTFPPPEYRCPQVQLTMGPGTFAVVVLSYGTCAGTLAEYQLEVSSGDSSSVPVPVTLIQDDVVPPE